MAHWRAGGDAVRGWIGQQIATAAQNFGFFYVRNHGIPADITAGADDAMRTFFDLPEQYKYEIEADKSRSFKTARGYLNVGDEQLDVSGRPDLKEVLDIGLPLGERTATYLGPNPWPTAMPQLQNATEAYLKAAMGVGTELLSAVARSVGLPENGFAEIFDEPLVMQRLMRYPAKDNVSNSDSVDLGCGAHYDFGGLTLLRQTDAPGLQVMPPAEHGSDGQHVIIEQAPYSTVQGTFYSDLHNVHASEWVPIDLHPDLLVVTFGEALQRMTNGKVQATRHRVVHDGATARHSMAVFVDPNPHKEVTPLPELAEGQPKYAPRIAGHKTLLLAAAAVMQKRLGIGYLGFNKV
jgi:isopenicillin N synthase-like dioxygenase